VADLASRLFPIPATFGDKVVRVFGSRSQAWLRELPALLAECVGRWNLSSCEVAADLSVNYVGFAQSPEFGPVVLKAGPPHLELYTGMDALRAYEGRHACRLHAFDKERGVLLMERLLPGNRLKDESSAELRIAVGAELAAGLPVALSEPHWFPRFESQMHKAFRRARRENRAGPEFLATLERAEVLYENLRSRAGPRRPAALLVQSGASAGGGRHVHNGPHASGGTHTRNASDSEPPLLLHGDLHHENILRTDTQPGGAGWKVIDPQGRIGEGFLECARFLLNEWEWFGGMDSPARLEATMATFAARLGEDLETIAAACYLDCAVSRCWSLEDGEDPEVIKSGVAMIRALEPFLP